MNDFLTLIRVSTSRLWLLTSDLWRQASLCFAAKAADANYLWAVGSGEWIADGEWWMVVK
jgi:hypothetical protein